MIDTIIKKIIPLGTLIILLSSIITNTIYYRYFNININEYISFSDFSLMFINDLGSYVYYIIVFIAYLPFVYLKDCARKKYGADNMPFSFTRKISLVIMALLLIFIFVTLVSDESLESKLSWILICFLIFIAMIVLALDIKLQQSIKFFGYVVGFLILVILPITISITRISEQVSADPKCIVEFEYIGTKIHSDSNCKFIGKTRGYIFLYDVKKKKTDVYEDSKVANFTITELNTNSRVSY